MMNEYYVYLLTNKHNTVLYTGVTNDLSRRIGEHQAKQIKGFTNRYNVTKLVYYEGFSDIREALEREKEIKGWVRAKKYALIEAENPQWEDLSTDWP